jgi:hypothetical protein
MVTRFHEATSVYPGARFLLAPKEQEAAGRIGPVASGEGEGDSAAEPEDGTGSDSVALCNALSEY